MVWKSGKYPASSGSLGENVDVRGKTALSRQETRSNSDNHLFQPRYVEEML